MATHGNGRVYSAAHQNGWGARKAKSGVLCIQRGHIQIVTYWVFFFKKKFLAFAALLRGQDRRKTEVLYSEAPSP